MKETIKIKINPESAKIVRESLEYNLVNSKECLLAAQRNVEAYSKDLENSKKSVERFKLEVEAIEHLMKGLGNERDEEHPDES